METFPETSLFELQTIVVVVVTHFKTVCHVAQVMLRARTPCLASNLGVWC